MKKSTGIIIGIVVLALVGVAAFAFINKADTTATQAINTNQQPATTTSTQQTTSTATSATGTKTYTLADISSHNSRSSCWMAIDGSVYDVTSFISSHPGGSQILRGCGIDATTLFNTKGGRGEPHSSRAQAILKTLYIGQLAS